MDDVRVVVLEGEGDAFSAGADLVDLASLLGPHGRVLPRQAREVGELGRRAIAGLCRVSAVTVAKVRGAAIGGGALLALACDLRVVAHDARVSVPEVQIGIPLGWGGVELMVRELSLPLARDLLLTGRALTATELGASGFAHRLVDASMLDAETDALVRTLLDAPPLALALAKRQLVRAGDRGVGIDPGTEALVEAVSDPSFPEHVQSYLAKRRSRP
jgi:enoyl-CoA hydratase/carnithine racemase